ncbi:MAG: carbonic anhydrase [Deltaproteobacteria bacterium]|nr:carbonic anhydrase [Deltaproteobacteria bacterium]
MQKLLDGLHDFQSNVFAPRREFFERLALGQRPEALFITCSDSRINPNLLTQADPGELFIIRNAGNIVPPYGAQMGGEAATVEFGVAGLGVRDIIVCGHSQCGAMKGLLNPASLERFPALRRFLGHADATERIIRENYQHLDGEALLTATVEENVLVQLENLRTHPVVAAKLARKEINLHGWVYKLETGTVFSYHPGEGQFLPLGEQRGAAAPGVAHRAI